ncbi:MAG: hypothetical protein SFV52_10290 [Saprospiraceae bacterium]|nr:hypothetical protein [Saprospiraceae bacterium]
MALPLVFLLLGLGLRNHPDPLWEQTRQLLRSPTLLVAHAADSLQHLHAEVHELSAPVRPGDSSAYLNIMFDYTPTMEWDKFAAAARYLKKNRFMVVSGVTGVGSTTLSLRVARLFAQTPERLLEIRCAPHFDLEYHKKYIGREDVDGRFNPGLLLKFWEKCRREPNKPFVAVIDNFDKINPETFFGPDIWEVLNDRTTSAQLGGQGISIPENFYLISVTHLGPGAYIELNEEHFKRIGRLYIIEPNARELLAKLNQKAGDINAKPHRNRVDENRLAALRDTQQMLQFLYTFQKANETIARLYSEGYQLGQGSNIREYFRKEDYKDLKSVYINHVNAFQPARPMSPDDFDDIDYTLKHAGLQPGSNFIARQIRFLQDTGYLVEISVVSATALLTALIGWLVFRRREQLIRRYGDRVRELYRQFEEQEISSDAAAAELENIKREVDGLVLTRKLNYTEGLYFLAFIEDKVKSIELAKNVTSNFLELFNTFMEDGYLSENEYQKICNFLNSLQHKLPDAVYLQFLDKVNEAYHAGAAARN